MNKLLTKEVFMSELMLNDSKESAKQIRRSIREKLETTLSGYRSVMGEKKFENRIRKVARQWSEDISKGLPKKKKVKKTKEIIPE